MKTRALVLIFVIATLFLGTVGILAQTTRPGETLQLWEYRTEIARVETRRDRDAGAADAMLNAHGQQGWELVGMTRREVRVDDLLMTETIYTFKRPTRLVNR